MKATLNQREAAEYLGVSLNTFKQRVRPDLKRIDLGRRMLFPVAELDKWVDRRARGL